MTDFATRNVKKSLQSKTLAHGPPDPLGPWACARQAALFGAAASRDVFFAILYSRFSLFFKQYPECYYYEVIILYVYVTFSAVLIISLSVYEKSCFFLVWLKVLHS